MQKIKLIVVGDPHIEAVPTENRGVNSAKHLAQLVAHVNKHHSDADLCLFLGDLTHDGDPAEYAHFQSLITPLKVPTALMIGNHDHRANFLSVFPSARQDENGFIQFAIDLGSTHRLIALDSLNAPPYTQMRHVGMLCEQRLNFLETQLHNAGDRTVIVAMHHQPFRIGLPGMDVIRLWNGSDYLELLGRYPNVKLLLMGHNHRSISGVSHNFPFACFTSLSPQTPLDFNSLDPSGGIAEPPSYGVLLLTPDGILVHQENFTVDSVPISNWEHVEKEIKEGWQQLASIMLP